MTDDLTAHYLAKRLPLHADRLALQATGQIAMALTKRVVFAVML